MTSIVIRHASWWRPIWSKLLTFLPPSIGAFWAGPSRLVTIDANGNADLSNAASWWRPVEVYLDQPLVLSRRLSAPAEARSDINHATLLQIRTHTPFDPDDLLIYVGPEATGSDDDDQLHYRIYLTDRQVLLDGLKNLRIKPSKVRRLGLLAPANAGEAEVDFAPLLWRIPGAVRRLVELVPIAAIVIAGIALMQGQLGALDLRSQSLTVLLDEKTQMLRRVSEDADRRQIDYDNAVLIGNQVQSGQSVFDTLVAVRQALPSVFDLYRMEGAGQDLRLYVRTIDTLGGSKEMSDALPNWSVAVDGAIVRDPATLLETAVILLKRAGTTQ